MAGTPTFLLTWNSDPNEWPSRVRDTLEARDGRLSRTFTWRCGISKQITKRNRVFLLKQGKEPRGIMGSGWTTADWKEWEEGPRNNRRLTKNYVPCRMQVILDPETEEILTRDRLLKVAGPELRNTRASGIRVADQIAAKLEKLWQRHVSRIKGSRIVTPEGIVDIGSVYVEGGVKLRMHREIERSQSLRAAAQRYWQERNGGRLFCMVCGFDFEQVYGNRGAGFIEMHHDRPLAESPTRVARNASDLKPVCSNCHSMLHWPNGRMLSDQELKRMLKRRRRMPFG